MRFRQSRRCVGIRLLRLPASAARAVSGGDVLSPWVCCGQPRHAQFYHASAMFRGDADLYHILFVNKNGPVLRKRARFLLYGGNLGCIWVNPPLFRIPPQTTHQLSTILKQSMFCPEGSSKPSGVGECPSGFYCPAGIRIVCPVGTHCPREGHWDPMPCPPGEFNAMVGQQKCTSCPRGFICPGFGRIDPAPCPPGMACSRTGLASPNQRCPAGKE